MCGITGALYRHQRPDEAVLRAMTDTLAHRGPDGDGVHLFAHAGLGHRRLSIVDLTPAAAQPLMSDDGLVGLAFNGELYNFQTLRTQLQALGHTFRSTGDTEVLLKAYLQWGVEAVRRLDGMFAFAVVDSRDGSLLLGRDRTGKKPLYVYEDGEKLLFGSELKAILAHPGVDRAMRPQAPAQFLSHGYVPSPDTFYQRIRKLPPSNFERFDAQGQSRGPQRYWDFPMGPSREVGDAEAIAQVRTLFTQAVEKRLVADVPLGAFLSGGVDSSLVVGVMAQVSRTPVKTFSIGFQGYPAWDETAFAREVATRFRTEHTEFKVEPEAFGLVEKLAWHYDEPFGDSSAIPSFIVSSLTQKHVKVALTGDGGDEVFAGYSRFRGAVLAEKVPAQARAVAGLVAGLMPEPKAFHSLAARARRLAQVGSRPMPERLRGWLSFFSAQELRGLLRPEYAQWARESVLGASYVEALKGTERSEPLNQVLVLNARTYLLDDLNVKMDRASMAASLETRSPFLDTALMEYAFALPGHLKLRRGTTKWVLKEAFRDLLPESVVKRKKMGFGVPLGAWFKGALKSQLQERLLAPDAQLLRLVERSALERLFGEHQEGLKDYGGHFWSLWMLELWLQREQPTRGHPA